jgi:hypothetical protein
VEAIREQFNWNSSWFIHIISFSSTHPTNTAFTAPSHTIYLQNCIINHQLGEKISRWGKLEENIGRMIQKLLEEKFAIVHSAAPTVDDASMPKAEAASIKDSLDMLGKRAS